ncbi:MAG: peroxiredoxin [Deltaproteobacteria bacterium RIFOXYD12_FULL_57_12]|nr:MAG: peroxiredoxin [Deltaproteobacteria bacterium RIFOXYD12_FULL_57_12]
MNLQGKQAPDFRLAGSDGREHCLQEYSGKIVVIYFYPRDNTPGCTKEACSFRDLHRELVDLDAVVLGVSRDSLTSHDKFISQFGLPFVLLSDPDAEMMKRYGAFGEKTSYGKTVLGTIRSTVVVGRDGVVLKHWQTVKKTETHPQEVLDFLKRV